MRWDFLPAFDPRRRAAFCPFAVASLTYLGLNSKARLMIYCLLPCNIPNAELREHTSPRLLYISRTDLHFGWRYSASWQWQSGPILE